MRLNAGEPTAYGSIAAADDPESLPRDDVEAAPLLTPEPRAALRPLSKEELQEAAGGPRWNTIRSRLVLLFWLSWIAMLGTAIFIVVKSPRPVARPLRWWQKSLLYRLQPALFMDSREPGSRRGIEGEGPFQQLYLLTFN